jgi:hypothetical protein
MKIALIALLFALAALAQAQTAGLPTACGPKDAGFDVKLDKSQQTPAPPEPGKAQVYFIRDDGLSGAIGRLGYPSTKIGIDGVWVGASLGNSYFSVSVVPGEHHVCMNLDSRHYEHKVELAHFTAETGKVYYFRTRLIAAQNLNYLDLIPVDSDQAKYLIASYPLSVSRARK